MALIEGFGDEVIQFFGILFIVVLIILIWMSTQVVEMQIFRGAVFILERRTRIRHTTDLTLEQRLTQVTAPVPSISESPTPEMVPINVNVQANSSISNDNPQDRNENDVTRGSITQSNELSQSTCTTNDASNELSTYEDSIKIRLKYLNDNCRLVEGRLQENIGVFKRRHFSSELSSNKIIRLIFQGKVLHDNEATLSSCGLHDNCVVHCLIHQPRPTISAQQTHDPADHDIIDQPPNLIPNLIRRGQRQPGPVQREWNLATLLSALITVIISLLWYARIHFYTLFSYTSTGTLGILTAIFIFTAILTFLVENEDHQQYHQPQLGQ